MELHNISMLDASLEWTKAIAPMIAIVAAPWLALRVYFRQKEYETTKQRYLEGCVDALASETQNTLGILSHNYARCLTLCKAFRDLGEHFDSDDLAKGFLPLDNSRFLQTANFRLESLIGSDVAWRYYQSTLAFSASADSLWTKEIPDSMRILCKRNIPVSERPGAAHEMMDEARKKYEQSFEYSLIFTELSRFAEVLEKEQLRLKDVRDFSQRSDTRAAVRRLESALNALT